MALRVVVWSLSAVCAVACTSFYMPKNLGYELVGRTMDYTEPLRWLIKTYPASSVDAIGFVGVESSLVKFQNQKLVAGGLSIEGMTCDAQILVNARYQSIVAPYDTNITGVFAGSFCGWVLSTFRSAPQVTAALKSGKYTIWGPRDYAPLQLHFVVRDRSGQQLVVEYVDAVQHLYTDSLHNLESTTIVTNEPTYDFHLQNVQLLRYKMNRERTALGIPGDFYPDERFLRVYVTLEGIKTVRVTSYNEAMAITMSVADRVHVPRGEQYGTDTRNSSGLYNSHTQYSTVYDLTKLRVYWRTALNPSLQGVRLDAVDLTPGAKSVAITMNNDAPLYIDMTSRMG